MSSTPRADGTTAPLVLTVDERGRIVCVRSDKADTWERVRVSPTLSLVPPADDERKPL